MNAHPREKVLRGWLRRKGGRLKTWSRRWCVLTDGFLFMYIQDDDRKSQDCITLSEQIIVEPPLDPTDPQYGYFNIVSEYDGGLSETISLCADTEEEKRTWVRALTRVLYADKGGALFSQSLEEIMYWEHIAGRSMPYIVDQCVEYLYKYGLDVEGIFRLPGRQTVAKDIIARFERGQKIVFEDEGTDVHVVASVLKTFLRNLPDSIIPCKLFQKFMNIALRFVKEKNETRKETSVLELVEAVKLIPKDNYTILKYICCFLREVGHHESTNKMSLMSLGMVFSYNIIRHIDNENNQLFLLTADLGQNLIYMLLKYYIQIFLPEYSSEEDNNTTKDLLRMSHSLDVPVILPEVSITSSVVPDYKGIDRTAGWSLRSSELSGISDGSLSPAEYDKSGDGDGATGYRDMSVCETRIQSKDLKSLHLSLSEYDAGSLTEEDNKCLYSSSSPREDISPSSESPRRQNTRLTRNKYLSGRRRPEAIMLGSGEWLPRGMRSPGGVNSEDVFTALALMNCSSQNCSPTSANLDIDYDHSEHAPEFSPAFETKEVTPSKHAPEFSPAFETKEVTPSKHAPEFSSAFETKEVTPSKHAPEFSSAFETKEVTPSKHAPEFSSAFETKEVTPSKHAPEFSSAFETKEVTPSKHAPEFSSAFETKEVTPSKHAPEFSSAFETKEVTPSKHAPEFSSAFETKEVTPSKHAPEFSSAFETKEVTPSKHAPEFSSAFETKEVTPSKHAPEFSSAFETKEITESSFIDLMTQITVIKEELSHNRNCHKSHVTALQAELSDMTESYECQIETVQTEYKSRIKKLENKLSEERLSCSDVFAEIDRLQEKVNMYKILYGELP